MKDLKDLLQQIKDPKEKQFIKTLLEYSLRVEKQQVSLFTDFHDGLWMRQMVERYIGTSHLITCSYFGGYEGAQRQIIGILAPYDLEPEPPISCLKVVVKTGIGKPLTHRDYLGALLGLGLQRDVVGDIIIASHEAYIILKANMASYVCCALTQIGKYSISDMEEVPFSELPDIKPSTKLIQTTVASLRADAVLCAGFGISRGNCAKLIQGDKALCNGIKVASSTLLKEGDILSLRGYGKMRLQQINGQTKKERVHICIEKYI